MESLRKAQFHKINAKVVHIGLNSFQFLITNNKTNLLHLINVSGNIVIDKIFFLIEK